MNHFSVRKPWIVLSVLMLVACVAIGGFLALQPAAPMASVVILPPESQIRKAPSRLSQVARQSLA